MSDTSVVRAQPGELVGSEFGAEQVQLLKDTVCKGATDQELRLFVEVCKAKRLDPFARQIHAVKRWDNQLGRETMTFQTGIDGYRLIAERTTKYAGQDEPMWCGEDGVWKDVWLAKVPPAAARAVVHRHGFIKPLVRVARWGAYVQTKKDGHPNSMWSKMGPEQLHKCAEALALRAAFPEELAGLYTREEMGQAENENGSREAQQAVAVELIEAGTKQLEATKAEVSTGPKELSKDYATLKRFKTAKGNIGDFDYYRILRSFGVEHANEITDPDRAKLVLRGMAGWLNASEPWVRLQNRDTARFDALLVSEGCSTISEAVAHADSAGILLRIELAMSTPVKPKTTKAKLLELMDQDSVLFWRVAGNNGVGDAADLEALSPPAAEKLLAAVQLEKELGV